MQDKGFHSSEKEGLRLSARAASDPISVKRSQRLNGLQHHQSESPLPDLGFTYGKTRGKIGPTNFFTGIGSPVRATSTALRKPPEPIPWHNALGSKGLSRPLPLFFTRVNKEIATLRKVRVWMVVWINVHQLVPVAQVPLSYARTKPAGTTANLQSSPLIAVGSRIRMSKRRNGNKLRHGG